MKSELSEDLHRRAEAYDWDGGLAGIAGIARHPNCDRATALLIYWRLAPHYYRRFAGIEEAPARVQSAASLIRELEARLMAGQFRTSLFSYDPADDNGLNRTVASDEEERLAVRAIPAELYQATGPLDLEAAESATDRLERACRAGDGGALDAALAGGALAKLGPSAKRTLMEMAVEGNQVAVVQRLIAAGAPVRFRRGHLTLLDRAVDLAMIDLLAGNGADPAQATLALAVVKGPEVIQRLVELGTPINGLSRFGEPAVYRAAADGHIEVLWKLIELGVDRDTPRQSDGRTALQAVDERLEILATLLQSDAPYDSPERSEYGRLMSARIALTGDRRTEDARFW